MAKIDLKGAELVINVGGKGYGFTITEGELEQTDAHHWAARDQNTLTCEANGRIVLEVNRKKWPKKEGYTYLRQLHADQSKPMPRSIGDQQIGEAE